MDCDRYERVLMDLLYGELDELTRASANRHADQCSRCRQLVARLRATREVGVLPLEDPPESFEARILAAERRVHEGLPLRVRLGRSLTIIGGYAMRPQLAMAALALLMIGSSLAFLRPRPGAHTQAVQVSQRGVPTPEPEAVMVPIAEPPSPAEAEPSAEAELHAAEEAPAASAADAPARPAPSASFAIAATSASAPSTEDELDLARQRAEDRDYTAAMAAFRNADYLSAQQQFDAIIAAGGRNAPAAELYASLAAEESSGCSAALPRFDSVAAKYPETHLAHTATWHSATCRAKLGLNRRAALDFERLLRVPAYAERARAVLNQPGLGAAAAADQSALSPAGDGQEQAPISKAIAPKKPSATASPTATAPRRPAPPTTAPSSAKTGKAGPPAPTKAQPKGKTPNGKSNRAKSKVAPQQPNPVPQQRR